MEVVDKVKHSVFKKQLSRARRPAGLMQGLPDGSEEARLQELEAELDRQAAVLKHVKAQNRQARAPQQPCLAAAAFMI